MGDRLVVDLLKDDEFIGKKPERPLRVAFGRFAGCKGDEVSFVLTVEFAFVGAVRILAFDGFEPVAFVELLPCSPRRTRATAE